MKNKKTQKINRKKIEKKIFGKKKLIVWGLVFLVAGAGIFLYRDYQAKGQTYGWIQAGWSGGADTDPVTGLADHGDNQNDWTKYYSKDSNVTAGDTMTLGSSATTITDTNTTPDFEAGTGANNNTNIFLRNDGNEIKIGRCGTHSLTYSGETYPTVLIGTQCWLTKNLNVGTMVTAATTQTNNSVIEKHCYSNDSNNCTTYGGLYQWNEAMGYSVTEGAQGICPSGWHIPTDAQQYTLENYLKIAGQACSASRNGTWECNDAGTKLKSGGSSGFNGLLAGNSNGGSFFNLGTYGYFWSSSVSSSSAWLRSLSSFYATVYRIAYDQSYGFSVRCLKD